jgi:hypothetical protein
MGRVGIFWEQYWYQLAAGVLKDAFTLYEIFLEEPAHDLPRRHGSGLKYLSTEKTWFLEECDDFYQRYLGFHAVATNDLGSDLDAKIKPTTDTAGSNMKSFDTRAYSISDFAEWNAGGRLVLDPNFQRRSVWSRQAKSYLIDTVLRGKPMPKVLITQSLVDGKSVRTVVDGQQRLRAILEFLDGSFTVLKGHNEEFAGVKYDDLPVEARNAVWQYEIGVDVLFETELSELLDTFARLNTYSVKLNETELLNATYLGSFKTTAHQLGHKYASYWLESKVLTEAKIARMAEVELSADLLGSILEGISPKKQVPNYYKKYDSEDCDADVTQAARKFDTAMRFIGEIYDPQDLALTNFNRIHLFYSLFVSIANMIDGDPDLGVKRRTGLSPKQVRVALDDISAEFDEYVRGALSTSITDRIGDFVEASRRATTDADKRLMRSRFISERLSSMPA